MENSWAAALEKSKLKFDWTWKCQFTTAIFLLLLTTSKFKKSFKQVQGRVFSNTVQLAYDNVLGTLLHHKIGKIAEPKYSQLWFPRKTDP